MRVLRPAVGFVTILTFFLRAPGFAWAWETSPPSSAKQPRPMIAAIEANLLTLVEPVVHGWWDEGSITMPAGAPEHGVPSVEATRACTLTAMRDIVLPGFERVGLDVGATRSWLADWQAAGQG